MRKWARIRNISGLDLYVNFDSEKVYEISSAEPKAEFKDLPAKYSYLEEYLRDHTKQPAIPEALRDFDMSWATPFQQKIYKALALIPCGTLVSYGCLAELAGRPGAARAVGSTMSKNRFVIAIPCHRVIASGRKIGGFSSGLDNKRILLRSEGIDDI